MIQDERTDPRVQFVSRCRNRLLNGGERIRVTVDRDRIFALWLLGRDLPLLAEESFSALNRGQRTPAQLTAAIARAGAEAIATAYTTVFLAQPDQMIVRAVATAIKDERKRIERRRRTLAAGRVPRRPADEPGFIYTFWNTTDDTERLLKIGRTARDDPRERVVEWERELGARPGELVLLYSFRTRYNQLAERLIHTALECEHEEHLRSVSSSRRMDEIFAIERPRALWVFLALAVRHVDLVGGLINNEY